MDRQITDVASDDGAMATPDVDLRVASSAAVAHSVYDSSRVETPSWPCGVHTRVTPGHHARPDRAQHDPKGQDAIGVRVGEVVDQYQNAEHLVLEIRDDWFDVHPADGKVSAGAGCDGLDVIGPSVPAQRLATDDVVRGDTMLSQIERACRSVPTIDRTVPPIRQRLDGPRHGPHFPVYPGALYRVSRRES